MKVTGTEVAMSRTGSPEISESVNEMMKGKVKYFFVIRKSTNFFNNFLFDKGTLTYGDFEEAAKIVQEQSGKKNYDVKFKAWGGEVTFPVSIILSLYWTIIR